jgi:isopentenyl-diphosphate delta-isomerase
MEAAIKRRLYEELAISCPLKVLFKFHYQAQFDATGAENELCGDSRLALDQPRGVAAGIVGARNFTPRFEIEWTRIGRDHRAAVLALQSDLGLGSPAPVR